MKRLAPFLVALTIATLLPGCGGGGGVKFSDLFDESAAAEGTGVQFAGVVRAVVILATHDATAHQRQVAEENGKRTVAKLQARLKAQASSSTPHRTKTITSAKTVKREKKAQAAAPAPEKKAPAKPKALPRIIAVATEKDEHTDKNAAKAVMLFDTHAQTIIGNKVYDIEREPATGDKVRFETYSSSYFGASL